MLRRVYERFELLWIPFRWLPVLPPAQFGYTKHRSRSHDAAISLPAPSAACLKSHVAAVAAGHTIIGFHEPEMILGVRT
jgi:hypothetical protein